MTILKVRSCCTRWHLVNSNSSNDYFKMTFVEIKKCWKKHVVCITKCQLKNISFQINGIECAFPLRRKSCELSINYFSHYFFHPFHLENVCERMWERERKIAHHKFKQEICVESTPLLQSLCHMLAQLLYRNCLLSCPVVFHIFIIFCNWIQLIWRKMQKWRNGERFEEKGERANDQPTSRPTKETDLFDNLNVKYYVTDFWNVSVCVCVRILLFNRIY